MKSKDFSHFAVLVLLSLGAGLGKATPGSPSAAGKNGESAAAANAWPGWRGPNRDGTSTQKLVFPENFALATVWKKKLGSGYSAIAIANGHAITMCADGDSDYMISFDAGTGNEHWRYRIAPTYPGRDGSNNGPASTPALDEQRVFGIGPRGQLFALALSTGKELWTTSLVEKYHAVLPHWGFTTSPLLAGDLLIVETGGTQNNAITAFHKKTGKVVWSTGSDNIEYQSPLLAKINGQTQLLWAGEKSLFGCEPRTGKELWRFVHGGDGFYQRIINPVMVGDNRMLLTNGSAQAKLVQVTPSDSGFAVTEIWKSVDLKRNYNIPVYYQGYIYGFSGDFLTCVNATTGALAWKSRPPGNGFTILVDGHLAVMTKKGSLHIALASPEGYAELASQPLFDKLVWSPPSFAEGKFYVRNSFDEIACVGVVNRNTPAVTKTSDPAESFISNSEFGKFVKRVESASEKRDLLDQFMAAQKSFPILEGDSLVHIVYRGEGRDLALRGDLYNYNEEVPMRRLADTDFFYASFKLAPDAFLSYQIVKDLDQRMADPRNPNKVGATMQVGEISQIYMPRSAHPQYFYAAAHAARGRLDTLTFTSEKMDMGRRIWGGERRLQVYLPPGYDTSTIRYPVIYVNDGDNAVEIGGMQNTLDNLIGSTVQPVIAVFIQAISPYEFARLERRQYAQMLAEKLVPFIEARYRTLATPSARALLGGDEGGFSALYAGFLYSNVFGKVAGQSACPIAEGRPELEALVQKSARLPLQIYLDWGRYDYKYLLYDNDPAGFSRHFVALLRDKNYPVQGGESNDGSDYASWRRKTGRILQAFFPL